MDLCTKELGSVCCEMNSTQACAVNTGNKVVPELLYVDDMVLHSIIVVMLQRADDNTRKYCYDWRLSINVKTTNRFVFKTGRKLDIKEN